jgi:hypothetical protein
LFFSFGREFARDYVIQKEIVELTAKKMAMEEKNLALSELMFAVQTETFIEQEARTKLGLSKPGETTVVFPPDGISSESATIPTEEELVFLPNSAALANPLKWWYYFFDLNKFDLIKVYGNSSSR